MQIQQSVEDVRE